MNRTTLIGQVAAKAGISRADARRVVDALFDAPGGIIATALGSGDAVSLGSFGKLAARRREPRSGRNPRTAAEIRIAASVSAAFRPGAALKEVLSGRSRGMAGPSRGYSTGGSAQGGAHGPAGTTPGWGGLGDAQAPLDAHGSGGGGRG